MICSTWRYTYIYLHIHMQVIALYITGSVNDVLSSQHQKEIIRYIYNHQVLLLLLDQRILC